MVARASDFFVWPELPGQVAGQRLHFFTSSLLDYEQHRYLITTTSVLYADILYLS